MWISPDCHGIVDVLVIPGKQPSSGVLHTLRFICVCVWPLSAVCYNIASSSHRRSTLVFPGIRSHVSPHRLTSTTQPLCHCARVYHNIHNSRVRRSYNTFVARTLPRGCRHIVAVLKISIQNCPDQRLVTKVCGEDDNQAGEDSKPYRTYHKRLAVRCCAISPSYGCCMYG